MATLKRKASGAPMGASDAKKAKADASITSFFGQPRTAPVPSAAAVKTPATPLASMAAAAAAAAAGSAPEALPKFNKDKWVATLSDEQRDLLQLEIDTMDPSWLALLKDDIVTREFLELKRFLRREITGGKRIFPPQEDVYSWSRHTPFHSVKVVILGQDPYHNVNQAHGLAFSVRPPTPAPPSLKNMYKCLARDYPEFVPPPRGGGLLTPWAERGVLMLNTCLTVRAHEANSHANRGWERFTQRVIDLVAARRARGVVFMAWGTPAGKRVVRVDVNRHLVLKSVHPSPLSAMRGFFECGHFRTANEWLVRRYGAEGFVDWSLTEGVSLGGVKEEKEDVKEDVQKSEDTDTTKKNSEFDDFEIDSDMEEAIREAENAAIVAGSATRPGAPAVTSTSVLPSSSMALDTSPVRAKDEGRADAAAKADAAAAAAMARIKAETSGDETEVETETEGPKRRKVEGKENVHEGKENDDVGGGDDDVGGGDDDVGGGDDDGDDDDDDDDDDEDDEEEDMNRARFSFFTT